MEDDLVKGEKRLLIQILHFFITKMSELKTKYYLSKFSNALKIGEEYTGDEEIIDLLSKYRELQADFSTYYSLFEERKQTVPVNILTNSLSIANSRIKRRHSKTSIR